MLYICVAGNSIVMVNNTFSSSFCFCSEHEFCHSCYLGWLKRAFAVNQRNVEVLLLRPRWTYNNRSRKSSVVVLVSLSLNTAALNLFVIALIEKSEYTRTYNILVWPNHFSLSIHVNILMLVYSVNFLHWWIGTPVLL